MTVPLVSPEAERRAAARRSFHSRIAIQLADHQRFVGQGIDISYSGLALYGPRNLSAGTHCEVQFSLILHDGSNHSVILAGVIINSVISSEHGIFRLGLHFDSVPEPHREALHQYMAAQTTQSG